LKWVTRAGMHVDRTACAWLIRNHIDPDAEFSFVAASTDATGLEGRTFDMRAATYTHEDGKCTFEVLLERHDLGSNSGLCEMGRIIRDADVPSRGRRSSESSGLDAIMRGFQLSVLDDYAKLSVTAPVYDALYAYCAEKASQRPRNQATPRPRLSYRKRFVEHLDES
jgi:hypothetical protein